MKEIDVALTDYAIALLCFYFITQLIRLKTAEKPLKLDFIGLYFSIALAALLGGTTHGFLDPGSPMYETFWTGTLLSIGVSAFYLWSISFYMVFTDSNRFRLRAPLWAGLIFYAYLISNVTQGFRIAIIAYLPAVLFLIFALLFKHLKSKDQSYLKGLIGLVITLVAAYIQQSEIHIHPDYFNHNALYHVVQAVGLYYVYKFSLNILKKKEG